MPAFDRDEVEMHVQRALADAGESPDILPSRSEGVVAFSRPGTPVDWDAVAASLGERTGLDVACVAHCDWSFDDREDEEATFVAFDVPGLDPGYADPARSLLSAPSPRMA